VYEVPHTLEDFEWTLPLPLDRVEALIGATPHDTVYLIHHETTTGVLNPLREVAKIAKRHHKWVLVDAVSSVAGEELDLSGWGVDLIVGSANKCLRGVPGVSFTILSEDLVGAISKRRQVAFSTDLVTTLSREERGETPFTPPVQTMYALREALLELAEDGVENRIASYQGIAKTLRDGLSSLGFNFLVPREHLSNTMTSVMLPEGFSYGTLHDRLKDLGYVIYKSQGQLSDTTFRLGTVGLITQDDMHSFLNTLGQVLRR
jgi:2-aminoethylphosphonate-pyruvate transaminase